MSVGQAATQVVLVPQPVFKKKKVVSLGLKAEVQPMAPGGGVPTGAVTFEIQVKSKKKVTEKVLGTRRPQRRLGHADGQAEQRAQEAHHDRLRRRCGLPVQHAEPADADAGVAQEPARPMVMLQARGRGHARALSAIERGRHA